VLLDQAAMIQRASERSVPEGADRDDIRRRHEEVLAADRQLAAASESKISGLHAAAHSPDFPS
jgi:hypothetical protein